MMFGRLRSARVLVAGICGLGAEVAKNLVLSGVKSVTLLDDRKISHLDLAANFLASADSLGLNIAEASLERLQSLNPIVEVHVNTSSLDEQHDEFFAEFDVVCVTYSSHKERLVRIGDICHSHKILFFAGDVYGEFGFFFSDLQDFHYCEEMVKLTKPVVKTGENIPASSDETKMVERETAFVSLGQALDVVWSGVGNAGKVKATAPGYFMMLVLLEFQRLHNRRPDPSLRSADVVELLTIKNALLGGMEVPAEKVPNQMASLVFGQLSPVCAIVGGILAQEVIKAVSHKDKPINNFFFYSSMDGAGVVECVSS